MKPEGAEEASKPMHLARFAIAHFDGLTEEDRGQLIEEARNGDKAAQEELEAAVTTGLERVHEILADVNGEDAGEQDGPGESMSALLGPCTHRHT